MKRELSIIFPVHNLEHEVSQRLHRLLEFTGDLTVNFEIIVIDDYSSDQTAEIIAELANSYPQIVLMQNYFEKGFLKSIEKVLSRATCRGKHKRVYCVVTSRLLPTHCCG